MRLKRLQISVLVVAAGAVHCSGGTRTFRDAEGTGGNGTGGKGSTNAGSGGAAQNTGGAFAAGGTAGGPSSGGLAGAGTASGGLASAGESGSTNSGGTSNGGAPNGGSSTGGGASMGGSASGGEATSGGASTGGTSAGGTGASSNGGNGASSNGGSTAGNNGMGGTGMGGKAANGGASSGGIGAGGTSSAGASSGGTGAGGTSSGGAGMGGKAANGGTGAGGKAASGGTSSGGTGMGGTGMGGTGAGGTTSGTGGSTLNCSGPALSGGTQHCSSNASNTVGTTGYSWTIWSSGTGGCVTPYGVGAAFNATWNNSGDFLARVGLALGSTKTYDQLGTLSAEFAETKTGSAGGYSYVGIYGWSVNPTHEYYIVDDWFGNRPVPGTKIGTVTLDGGTYDILTHNSTGSSIDGSTSWVQFWSLRQQARSCGHISITEHFKAWANLNLVLGKMEEAKVLVEVGGGVGSIDFTSASVTQQ